MLYPFWNCLALDFPHLKEHLFISELRLFSNVLDSLPEGLFPLFLQVLSYHIRVCSLEPLNFPLYWRCLRHPGRPWLAVASVSRNATESPCLS